MPKTAKFNLATVDMSSSEHQHRHSRASVYSIEPNIEIFKRASSVTGVPAVVLINAAANRSVLLEKLASIPCMGLFMAWLSGICFATASFIVELINQQEKEKVDASFVVMFKSTVQLCFYLPIMWYLGNPILGVDGEKIWVFLRALTGFVSFTLNYYALGYIALGDASAIVFAAPVFVSIFAFICIKESCDLFKILTVLITIVGVVLIARPSFIPGLQSSVKVEHFSPHDRMIGASMALITCLCMAYSFVVMRKLQQTPLMSTVTYFSLFCIVACALCIVIMKFVIGMKVNFPTHFETWCLCLANGMCGVFGQALLVLSLRIEQAGLVSLARTFDIVMAFIYQATVLHQEPAITSIIGAVIVCTSCVSVALKIYLESQPRIMDKISKIFKSGEN